MIKQVLLVLSYCAFHTVRANYPCLGAPAHTHSFAAAPESCNAYILCMDNQTIRNLNCPVGMLFEPLSQTCGASSCFDCSPFGIQNLPHPTDCYQYLACIMGQRNILTCPNGLAFDRILGHCNFRELVQCPGDPITPDPTDDPFPPPDTTPWYPPEDTTEWTPEPWPPETTTAQPPVDYPICIPGGQVHHAHPTDCTRFFLCVQGTLWPHQCPNNLHWNQRITNCDLPEQAGCIVRPTDSPTDPPLFPPETTTFFHLEE